MSQNDAFLSITNLSVTYTSEGSVVHAVNDVSLELKKGHTVGLVGETGAGKTTIAKAILRITELQASVENGTITMNGVNLLDLSEEEMLKIRGKKISMIFQEPMTALNPVMRIGDQISEAIRLHNKVSKKEAKVRAGAMLKMVGIPEVRYNEYPHQFSGGMKQRVVIAIALACSPELLLADEPTTALDVTIQAQVLEMISELKQKLNTSMIMITHDLGVVAEVCDEVAIIYAGQIVEYGSKEQIFDHAMHPYSKGLFGAIPDMEKRVSRLNSIPGLPPDPTKLPKGCCFSPRCMNADEACKTEPVNMVEVAPGHYCRCCKLSRQGD